MVWMSVFIVVAVMFVRLPHMVMQQDSVVRTFGPLVEVEALTRKCYVDVVPEDRLVQGAIRGLVGELDPYSDYLNPTELEVFRRRRTGEYVGIGIELSLRETMPTVIAPIDNSPASASGVKPGDIIVSIDDHPCRGLNLRRLQHLLSGEPGTLVKLSIKRPRVADLLTIECYRSHLRIDSVKGCRHDRSDVASYLIDPRRRIGYIRVSHFGDRTYGEFVRVLRQLEQADVRAVILDLRFNPGGLLHQAVAMLDCFLKEGVLVSTVNRQAGTHAFYATDATLMPDTPIVVLVNGSSASAAEIVSGALQDHGRATIVGSRSFGKGSVQHLIPLSNQRGAVKLTVAHYRLPNGRIIHREPWHDENDAWGIVPDVAVILDDAQRERVLQSRRWIDGQLSMEPLIDHSGNPAKTETSRARIKRQALTSALEQLSYREHAHRPQDEMPHASKLLNDRKPDMIWIDPQLQAALDLLLTGS